MSYLFVGLVCAALFHFIYESMLAPSFRLELRFELFKLRDELRRLKMDRAESLDDKHFYYLQDSINTLIVNLFRFDFATVARIDRETVRDLEFKKRVETRAKILDDCRVPEARLVRSETLAIAAKAFAVNSGGWLIYIVPVVVVWAGLSEIKRMIKSATSISEVDFEKAVPASTDPAGTLA